MHYCDFVQICAIMTQTDDIKPRPANEIFTISHSQISSVTRNIPVVK